MSHLIFNQIELENSVISNDASDTILHLIFWQVNITYRCNRSNNDETGEIKIKDIR